MPKASRERKIEEKQWKRNSKFFFKDSKTLKNEWGNIKKQAVDAKEKRPRK